MSDLKPDHQRRVLQQSNLPPLPPGRSVMPYQVVSGFQVAREVLSCFSPLDSFTFITYSPQKSPKIIALSAVLPPF